MSKGVVASVSCIALLLWVACEKPGPSRGSPDSTSTPPTSRPETTATAAPETTTTAGAGAAPDTTTTAEAPLRDAYHTAPLDTVDEKTYQGWKYYNLNCARCHGEDVLGTSIAPHLIVSLKPDGPIPNEAVFLGTVCGGRTTAGPSICP